jgi:hypothetical protein
MRTIALIFAVVSAVSLSFAAEEPAGIPVDSRIDAVTVYLDRAYVSRKAAARVNAGVQMLVFAGLPADLEDHSLRLSLSGPARLEGLQTKKTFLAQHEEEAIQKLEAEIRGFEDQVKTEQDALAVLEKAKVFLDSIQVARTERLSRELGREEGKGPGVEDYKMRKRARRPSSPGGSAWRSPTRSRSRISARRPSRWPCTSRSRSRRTSGSKSASRPRPPNPRKTSGG